MIWARVEAIDNTLLRDAIELERSLSVRCIFDQELFADYQ